MPQSKIAQQCEQWLLHAVVIRWKDPENDWHHFRIERVDGDRIALTGMTDPHFCTHNGDFFWVNASEIKSVRLR